MRLVEEFRFYFGDNGEFLVDFDWGIICLDLFIGKVFLGVVWRLVIGGRILVVE